MSGRTLRRGPPTANRIAITFDRGPHAMTPRYLEALDQLGIPATFFVVGSQVEAEPERMRDYLRGGHQIASHGFDGVPFAELSRSQLLASCRRTETALGGQLSGRPWIRSPGDALDARSFLALRAAGYTVCGWSVDPGDDRASDAQSIVEACRVGAGDVVRLHEGVAHTLEALPRIVRPLLDSGYQCVTMYDLFSA